MSQIAELLRDYKATDNDLLLDGDGRHYVMRLRDLPAERKPREKMMREGAGALTSAELLAIIFGVGTKREEVLTMAGRVLKEYGARNALEERNPQRLSAELNIPAVRACQIVACFELGRRFFKNYPNSRTVIRTSKQAAEYLKDMRNLSKECLRGLYLNNHYRIVHDETISIGTLTANLIHPREVFKPALEYSAAAVILAHNHPSGSVKPSRADVHITKQLIEAGKLLGVELLDHLIIAKHKYVSIFDECDFFKTPLGN